VAAIGRPLTFTARVARLPDADADAELPRAGTLVVTDADGMTTRLPMLASGETFTLKMDNVVGSFSYRAEAGAARSDTHDITAVEPINLAAGSPALTVTPPEYARATLPTETFTGFHELAALQHSTVRLEFRFTQPAEAAFLVWPDKPGRPGAPAGKDEFKPADGDPSKAANTPARRLTLAEDRLSASVELPAVADGSWKLLLV